MNITIKQGDSWEHLKTLPDNSIGSLVTDPPYLINFLGREWDRESSPAGDKNFWSLVLAKMKHGAHGVVFGHSRQHHRVMVALEDAGFEIRDVMMWMYGQGFPKNHNIGKSVDKLQGNTRQVVGKGQHTNIHSFGKPDAYTGTDTRPDITVGSSAWEGWGTALKPAYEPIILIRKPLEKGKTIAKNCLAHGVGGINIDASRIPFDKDLPNPATNPLYRQENDYKKPNDNGQNTSETTGFTNSLNPVKAEGRHPANIILDSVSAELLDQQAPKVGSAFKATRKKDTTGGSGASWVKAGGNTKGEDNGHYDELGGASRFYYHSKISTKERNWGMGKEKNTHPTVKPVSLMRYLVRLITPEGETVLDPFMGSGSTGMACALTDNDFIGFDLNQTYCDTAEKRINYVINNKAKVAKEIK